MNPGIDVNAGLNSRSRDDSYSIEKRPEPKFYGNYLKKLDSVYETLNQKYLDQRARAEPDILLLPTLCCLALSGGLDLVEPVNKAWGMLFAASYLLDAVEDGQNIEKSIINDCNVVSVSTGLIFRAELILNEYASSALDPSVARDILSATNHSILYMCAGQDKELTTKEPDLNQHWEIAKAKSGEFFALGCYSGVRLVTNSKECLEGFFEFGRCIGLIKQIADDLSDLWGNEKGSSDLITGHRSLPITYAMETLSGEKKKRFVNCLSSTCEDPISEAEARKIIRDSGAFLYLSIEIEKYRIQGERWLCRVCPPSEARSSLLQLLKGAGKIFS